MSRIASYNETAYTPTIAETTHNDAQKSYANQCDQLIGESELYPPF